MEASGCPRGTCFYQSERCSLGQSCRFTHGMQAMNSSGGQHRAVSVLVMVPDEVEEELEKEGAEGEREEGVQCLGVGVVLVAREGVVTFEGEDTGSVL